MSHDHANHVELRLDMGPAFAWATGLNIAYVLAEAGFGFYYGSLALLADAAHNLTDVAGLLLAWGSLVLAKRKPNNLHTYGFGKATILAALVNGAALMVAVGALSLEAIQRFGSPVQPAGTIVLWVALLGIAINGGTAMLFISGRKNDLNIEGAFLHMASDAAVSAGVVLSALLMIATGWTWIDPVVGLLIGAVIGWSSFGVMKSAVHLSLDGVPPSVDRDAVQNWLSDRPGVTGVHDLHVWAMSTTATALTAHIVMPNGSPGDAFLDDLAEELEHHFGIQHATLQIERGNGKGCRLAPLDIV